jgi:glycosyltransferase involved in cell wall biosynthesis
VRRALYVLADYPVLSQTFVRNEVVALREAGVEVDVLTLADGDPDGTRAEWAGPYTTLPVASPGRALADLAWWARRHPRRAARFVRLAGRLRGAGARSAVRRLPTFLRHWPGTGDVDVVHSHFGWSGSTTALYASALLDVPASVTLHANDIYVPPRDLRWRLPEYAHLVTVCTYNLDVIRRLSSQAAPVTVVPCGVRVPEEDPAPVAGAHVLTVGRMVPKKGFADLVRAMETVWAERPDATLEIIGDGPLREELAALVARSSHPERVVLSGSRPNDEVLAAMRTCSVFALACTTEPDGGSDALPVVIREAMARGRPVVSTSLAGIPETLAGVGWLAPPGRPDALGGALLEALGDQHEARRRGDLARERIRQRYTTHHTAEGMTRVFDSMTTARRGGHACA